jgi:hypothetical protein
VPSTITGAVVFGLAALHSWLSAVGSARAGVTLGAGVVAGWLIVARAWLVHQRNAAPAATTTAIATAAAMSARVRRSGRIMCVQRGAGERLAVGAA